MKEERQEQEQKEEGYQEPMQEQLPEEKEKENDRDIHFIGIRDFVSQFKNTGIDGQASVCVINNLNYVKDNSGIIMGDQANLGDVSLHGGSEHQYSQQDQYLQAGECFIESYEKLTAWLTQNYGSFDMAFIIALAVFERTPYLWVYELAEDLFNLIDDIKDPASNNKAQTANIQRIKGIGGKTYHDTIYNHTGKMQCEFICFQKRDYAKKVLNCIWKEYIFLREKLVRWLGVYLSHKNYTKAIRAINAMVLFSKVDFDYFSREVINVLLLKKDFMADYAVAQIMSQLYQDEKYRDNIQKNYIYWAKGENIHHLLTALLIGIANRWDQTQMELAVAGYIDKLLMEIGRNKTAEYLSNLPSFFAVGQRKAIFFKVIVKILYDKLTISEGYKYRVQRLNVGVVFLLFLMIDASQSNIDVMDPDKNIDMIFVKMCLIDNDVSIKLQKLWRFVWKNRETHQQTKSILERYLYQYGGCDQKKISYLKCFLYSFQETDSERKDMDYFLKKIASQRTRPVKTAERINYKLG